MAARTEKGAEFHIVCANLNLQRPNGNITAAGKVEVRGKDFQGSCERLTINWEEDLIQMEGAAHLSSRRNGELLELQSSQLRLRLSLIPAGPPPATPAWKRYY